MVTANAAEDIPTIELRENFVLAELDTETSKKEC